MRPSLTSLAIAGTLLSFGSLLQNSPGSSKPVTLSQEPETQEPEEELSEMEVQMERVKDAMRTLRRSIRKPESRSDSLAHVQECQEGLLLSKPLEPLMLAGIPEAEQAKFLRDFRLEMIATLEAYLDLERALLEERDDEARDLYKKAAGMEDPAHERFTDDG